MITATFEQSSGSLIQIPSLKYLTAAFAHYLEFTDYSHIRLSTFWIRDTAVWFLWGQERIPVRFASFLGA